jgi:uncharacterized protein YecE (DUF72 family)
VRPDRAWFERRGATRSSMGVWMTVHVGTSGWSYDHWTGVLYRRGLPSRDRLETYTESFSTVELNASFYRWPNERAFASWRERLPPGFTMSVKAPRGLTHARKLLEPEVWIERIATGLHALGDRLGMLIVQLPPALERDDARLATFLEQLPDWIRVAVEFRHESWHVEEVFAILERADAAYCVMSGANLPCILRATSRVVYVRMHGPDHEHLYAGSYSDDDLRWWAERIGEWERGGHEVFVYFNNDGEGHAVRNGWRLRELLDGGRPG